MQKQISLKRSKTNITGIKVELKRSIEHNVCTNVDQGVDFGRILRAVMTILALMTHHNCRQVLRFPYDFSSS